MSEKAKEYALAVKQNPAIADKVGTIHELTNDFDRYRGVVEGLVAECARLTSKFTIAKDHTEVIKLGVEFSTVEIEVESMRESIIELKMTLGDAIEQFVLGGQDKLTVEAQIRACDSLLNRLTTAFNRAKEAEAEVRRRLEMTNAGETHVNV